MPKTKLTDCETEAKRNKNLTFSYDPDTDALFIERNFRGNVMNGECHCVSHSDIKAFMNTIDQDVVKAAAIPRVSGFSKFLALKAAEDGADRLVEINTDRQGRELLFEFYEGEDVLDSGVEHRLQREELREALVEAIVEAKKPKKATKSKRTKKG